MYIARALALCMPALPCLACACWMLISGIASLFASGATPFGLLGIIAGVLLGCCGAAGICAAVAPIPWPAYVLVLALDLIGCAFALSCAQMLLVAHQSRNDTGTPVDFIVVHGAALRGHAPSPLLEDRLACALSAWKRREGAPTIIVSGAQGPDEAISEAAVMRTWLERRGVAADKIIEEDRSETTQGNIVFSDAVAHERSHGAPYRLALVSSDFHIPRCLRIARRAGIDAVGIGAGATPFRYARSRIREAFAYAASLVNLRVH